MAGPRECLVSTEVSARDVSTQGAWAAALANDEGRSGEVEERNRFGFWLKDLYDQNAAGLEKLAYLLVGDRGAAADITQEAFIRFMSRMQFIRDRERGEAYLRRTTVNLCRDHHRRRPRLPLLTRTGELPDTETIPPPNVATTSWVRDLIKLLPYRQRAVIVLRFHLDLSLSETAESLGCSIAAVKSLQVRALGSLRSQLEEEHYEY